MVIRQGKVPGGEEGGCNARGWLAEKAHGAGRRSICAPLANDEHDVASMLTTSEIDNRMKRRGKSASRSWRDIDFVEAKRVYREWTHSAPEREGAPVPGIHRAGVRAVCASWTVVYMHTLRAKGPFSQGGRGFCSGVMQHTPCRGMPTTGAASRVSH